MEEIAKYVNRIDVKRTFYGYTISVRYFDNKTSSKECTEELRNIFGRGKHTPPQYEYFDCVESFSYEDFTAKYMGIKEVKAILVRLKLQYNPIIQTTPMLPVRMLHAIGTGVNEMCRSFHSTFLAYWT